jgi:hypothetical protein
MARDLFRVTADKCLAYGTKEAVLEQIMEDWPEWAGKFDKFAWPEYAAIRGVNLKRPESVYYDWNNVPGGCSFWSVGALARWQGGVHSCSKETYHFEHVVPRNVIRNFVVGPFSFETSDEAWQVPFSSEGDTYKFLEKVCIGAVILPEENNLLDQRGFSGDLAKWQDIDPWERYNEVNRRNPGFVIYDLSQGKRVVPKE